MKYLLFLFLFTIATAMQNPPKKVIFFGDSITEAGVQPGGYISRVKDLASSEGKGAAFEFIGAGIGGNKIYDLFLRVETDVLSKKPDIVVVYVGVNDVWHKSSFGTGTDEDKFEKFYVALIRKLQGAGCKVILATPAAIGEKTDFSNPQDGDLNQYSKVIRKLATEYKLPVVDLRKAFLAYNLGNNPTNASMGVLTTDRVHLNEKGNDLVAREMWQVLKGM